MEPDRRSTLRFNFVGALVHNPEAHVFQDRHAFGQRQRPRESPHFQANGALLFLQAMMEIDTERPIVAQSLDDAYVAGCNRGRIGLVESLGKRITVTIEKLTRLVRRADQLERAAQSVAPRADDRGYLALEGPTIQLGHRSARATDDEMHTHKRSLAGKKRIKSRNASVKCA